VVQIKTILRAGNVAQAVEHLLSSKFKPQNRKQEKTKQNQKTKDGKKERKFKRILKTCVPGWTE
jgi:hypothetical protein